MNARGFHTSLTSSLNRILAWKMWWRFLISACLLVVSGLSECSANLDLNEAPHNYGNPALQHGLPPFQGSPYASPLQYPGPAAYPGALSPFAAGSPFPQYPQPLQYAQPLQYPGALSPFAAGSPFPQYSNSVPYANSLPYPQPLPFPQSVPFPQPQQYPVPVQYPQIVPQVLGGIQLSNLCPLDLIYVTAPVHPVCHDYFHNRQASPMPPLSPSMVGNAMEPPRQMQRPPMVAMPPPPPPQMLYAPPPMVQLPPPPQPMMEVPIMQQPIFPPPCPPEAYKLLGMRPPLPMGFPVQQPLPQFPMQLPQFPSQMQSPFVGNAMPIPAALGSRYTSFNQLPVQSPLMSAFPYLFVRPQLQYAQPRMPYPYNPYPYNPAPVQYNYNANPAQYSGNALYLPTNYVPVGAGNVVYNGTKSLL